MPLFTSRSSSPQETGSSAPSIGSDGIIIRRLESHEDYEDTVALQDEIWGAGFSDRVPAAILRVAQKIGGVSAGAFDPDGRLLGFVFGLTGVRGGRIVHWSDMLAVREDARGKRLGERLKQYQRELVRGVGVETMLWTFDPLVARNAHFNLNRLRTGIAEYAPNLYGSNTGSVLHGSLPTDRFIAEWDLRREPPRAAERVMSREGDAPDRAGAAETISTAPFATEVADGHVRLVQPFPDAPAVRVQIPHDIELVLALDTDTALEWRLATRGAFLHYLAHGYGVTGFDRGVGSEFPAYRLTRSSANHA
jgi:predicted GNAT superfamily acetyltransferase